MGLLDLLNSDQGTLGLSLLAAAAPQARRQSFGGGLLQALQAVQAQRDARAERVARAEDRMIRRQQIDLQQQQGQLGMQRDQLGLQQLQQQIADQAAQRAFRDSIPAPQGQPLPAGPYMGAARDSQAANVPQPTAIDPTAAMLHQAMRSGLVSPMDYLGSLRKDNTPFVLKEGETAFGRGTNGLPDFSRPLATNSKDAKPSDLARLLAEMNALPPGDPRRAVYQQLITKTVTHAPGTQVNVDRAPQGYMWQGPGKLAPIPGGPADKLPEKQQSQVIGVQNLRDAIGEYRSQLGTHSKLDVLSPAARAEMGTKYQNMMLQAKEAYNLGVLNGPDMQVLQSVITDPMSINGLMTPRRSLDRQAAELDRIMAKMAGTASQIRPRGATPAEVPAAPGAPALAPSPGRVVNFSDLKD